MSETFAGNDHNPTRRHVDLYRRWAQGGAGILVTGNVMVSREALAEPGNVAVEDERALPMLRQWAQAGSENGAQIWMQINHPGKQVPKNLSKLQPVSPSAVAVEGAMGFAFNPPRALTTDEVHDLVQRFITTAVIAKRPASAVWKFTQRICISSANFSLRLTTIAPTNTAARLRIECAS